ncbi:molecular chaperone [Xanthomonas sp. XNM01]|nr:molecular chaperone [Xanthomonas sp. XNM01]
MTRASRCRPWFRTLALVVCGLASGAAMTASLQVAPTTLELQAGQDAEALWLSNSGTDPVQVQVRLFRWTQVDGRDELQPTQDLLISPPMQQLGAGQRQLVRIMRAGAGAPPTQQYYRVIVDEVPAFDPDRSGMQFVLRYSVPVFVLPEGPAGQPDLQWRLVPGDDGNAQIEVSNAGDGHAQIADLAQGDPERPLIVRAGLVGYVLPGMTMRWPLEHPASRFQDGRFSARINGEPEQTPLPAAPATR